MDLARAPRRRPLTARKKGSGYENASSIDVIQYVCTMQVSGYFQKWRSHSIKQRPLVTAILFYFPFYFQRFTDGVDIELDDGRRFESSYRFQLNVCQLIHTLLTLLAFEAFEHDSSLAA
jgi:hypothetical protein